MEFKDWAEDILNNAHVYGPVYGKRYIGSLYLSGSNLKIYIEVWKIAGKIVTELSFKVASYEEALPLQKGDERIFVGPLLAFGQKHSQNQDDSRILLIDGVHDEK